MTIGETPWITMVLLGGNLAAPREWSGVTNVRHAKELIVESVKHAGTSLSSAQQAAHSGGAAYIGNVLTCDPPVLLLQNVRQRRARPLCIANHPREPVKVLLQPLVLVKD